TTYEDNFKFTDGQKDGGIDFFIRDGSSYTICQCKCPTLENLQNGVEPIKFDQEPLDELVRAIAMLQDREGTYDVKADIKRLRADYQKDITSEPEATNLTAILAVFGELTEPARIAFKSYRSSLNKQGIVLKLIEWKNIHQALHLLESPADIDFDISLQ